MSAVLLDTPPYAPLPLDPGFRPVFVANFSYQKAVESKGDASRVQIALRRPDGAVSRQNLEVLPPGSGWEEDTLRYLERQIKTLLWVKGGTTLFLSGPVAYTEPLCEIYSLSGPRAYDVRRMEVMYDEPLEIRLVEESQMPEPVSNPVSIGGFLDGCRIGFDLGASDYKLSAVIDGEPVFTTEIPWNPSVQTDPSYHVQHIRDGLKLAASHLPRVDAIGGSAAGSYVGNTVKQASLFRAVPEDRFRETIRPLFHELQQEWGVPFEVLNDGEVTALAGAMSLGATSLLGIAMGSSEATGYINRDSRFTGDYHELAYVPVDMNPEGAEDPVAIDTGCGAQYFSQQSVNRLAGMAGYVFPEDQLLPDRLKVVQADAEAGRKEAVDVFVTIGSMLGYTLPRYHEIFEMENVLILGRVTSGAGGDLVLDHTRNILKEYFPELEERLQIHVPDEKSRRVGQAVAAASLPETA